MYLDQQVCISIEKQTFRSKYTPVGYTHFFITDYSHASVALDMCAGWKLRGISLRFYLGVISKLEIHTFQSKCTLFDRNTHFAVEIHTFWSN